MIKELKNAATKSWKTTVLGWIAAAIVILTALQSQFDGNPETIANWETVLAAIVGASAFTLARDNEKRSEEAN